MYDTNNDGVLTDESIDLHGYDMAWRLVVVVQHDPPSMEAAAAMVGEGDPPSENLHGRVRVRERYFYHAAGDGSAAYGTGSAGPAGSDTPIMRLVDRNLDGDFGDYAEQQYFLANWRGDITAIMTPAADTNLDGVPDGPGLLLARVRYDAYGRPTIYHPADFDRDGYVGGGSNASEYLEDFGVLSQALAMAPFDAGTGAVEPKLRAWRAFANLANQPPPAVNAGSAAWQVWKDAQTTAYTQQMAAIPSTVQWADEFGNLPLYAGYWWDAKLDLYHVRHRVYDPVAGRWLQRDPIGYAGGNNLYGYGPNSPHVGSDPMGLSWDEWLIANDWIDDAANWGAGFGDMASGGVSELVRDLIGLNDHIDKKSGTYQNGQVAGVAVIAGAVTGGLATAYIGATAASTALGATAIGMTSGMTADLAAQGTEALQGRRGSWDPKQTAMSMAMGGMFGWVINKLFPPTAVLRFVPSTSVKETATQAARRVGAEGESAVGFIGDKIRTLMPSGKYRTPDGLTDDVLSEVKNVAKQSLTAQLRDYLEFATSRGLRFDLYVRSTTELSGPLKDEIAKGTIRRCIIPGT